MKYIEFATISENVHSECPLTPEERRQRRRAYALKRLKQLNQDRLDMIKYAVDREFRRYMLPGEYERYRIEKMLEQ